MKRRTRRFCGPEVQCCVTGMYGADLHHVTSRGAGGNDEPHNLMPLLHRLHVECETIGLVSFAEKYIGAYAWLVDNGWELSMGKWRHTRSHREL